MKKEAGFIQDTIDAIKNFFSKPIDETEKSELDRAVDREEELENIEEEDILEDTTPIEDEVLIQDIDVEEGEVEVNEYRLNIPPDLEARIGDGDVDHSYTALIYLQSLGYTEIDFMLNPAEDREYDICDELATMNPWDMEGLLQAAKADSDAQGYPIAPIFYLSHPGCLCYLHVHAPNGPEDIPDSAPGLHMWADPERLMEEKEELFNELPTIVEVDSLTMAPQIFERVKEIYSKDKARTKKGKATWIEEIKPVQIKETIFLRQPSGLVQIVNQGAKGFQLETYNEIAKVFLYEFGRELHVPINSLNILSLSLSNRTDPDEGDFVVADEEDLGIAYGMVDDELLVYDPEYNNIVRVDDWKVLEIV